MMQPLMPFTLMVCVTLAMHLQNFLFLCLCIARLFFFSILTVTAMIHVTLAMLSKAWLFFVMFAEAG